ncbi:MAG: hypothetical protein AABY94_02435 [Nitrospirota bacterium]
MEPKKFLELAQALAFESPQPAKLRTATSRAYYAAYNVGVEVLEKMGIQINRGPGGHGQVQRFLGNSKNEELQQISSDLGTLHSSRIAADYRLSDQRSENPNNVKAFVQHAKKIIETLERCSAGPNRHAIIKALKDHDQLEKGAARKE